jgi:hypothetical protein
MISKTISFDTLLMVLIAFVPVGVFFLTIDGTNPFINDATIVIVSLMSAFLLSLVWLKRHLYLPTLNIFILVYVVFWHLRYLTLAWLPDFELVLTRVNQIGPDQFNAYSIAVFVSLIAIAAGTLLAYALCENGRKGRLGVSARSSSEYVASVVKSNLRGIVLYCVAALFYRVYSGQIGGAELPQWLGYIGMFFPGALIYFFFGLVMFTDGVPGKSKLMFAVLLLISILATMLAGSRSALMMFLLDAFFLSVVFRKDIRLRLRHIAMAIPLGAVMVIIFFYGTYQRHLVLESGSGITVDTFRYVLESAEEVYETQLWQPIVGTALARAGYLDNSAEMYANPSYKDVVNAENIFKSLIDGYIPGEAFNDSRRVSIRIRDIYDQGAAGYQSDALGAIGENYLLFGPFFPIAIAFGMFLFSIAYYGSGSGILGLYFKYSIAIWIMTWWHSFGYDWLLMDIGQQAIMGMLVVLVVFQKAKTNYSAGAAGATLLRFQQ